MTNFFNKYPFIKNHIITKIIPAGYYTFIKEKDYFILTCIDDDVSYTSYIGMGMMSEPHTYEKLFIPISLYYNNILYTSDIWFVSRNMGKIREPIGSDVLISSFKILT